MKIIALVIAGSLYHHMCAASFKEEHRTINTVSVTAG